MCSRLTGPRLDVAQSVFEEGPDSANSRRFQVLQNAVCVHEILNAFRVLRAAHIEPVLLKGWCVGRFYPNASRTRLGDVDLLVCEGKLRAAKQALLAHELNVDWHTGSMLERAFSNPQDAVERSELVPLLDTKIRVFRHEDNLHFVAIHMLKHAGWDPRWVTDVSVLLHSRPSNFDWDTCPRYDAGRMGAQCSGHHE